LLLSEQGGRHKTREWFPVPLRSPPMTLLVRHRCKLCFVFPEVAHDGAVQRLCHLPRRPPAHRRPVPRGCKILLASSWHGIVLKQQGFNMRRMTWRATFSVQFKKRGFKMRWMTWRAISATALPIPRHHRRHVDDRADHHDLARRLAAGSFRPSTLSMTFLHD